MPVPTRTVYVGNIPYTSTQESLMEALADYEVVSIKVPEGKGIAFVELPARRAFGMVRDLDGSKLEGRMLSVSIATPRENEPTFTQEQSHDRSRRGPDRENSGGFRSDTRSYDRNPRFVQREGSADRGGYPRSDQDRNNRPGGRDGGDRDQNRPPRFGDRGPYNRGGPRDQSAENAPPAEQEGDRPGYQGRSRFGNDQRPPGNYDRPSNPDNRPNRNDDRPRSYGDRPPFRRDGERPGFNRDNGRPGFQRDGGRPGFNRGGPPRPDDGRYGGDRGPNGWQDRPYSDRTGPERGSGGDRGGYRGNRPQGGDDRPRRPIGDDRGARPPYQGKSPYSGADRGSQPASKPRKFFKKR